MSQARALAALPHPDGSAVSGSGTAFGGGFPIVGIGASAGGLAALDAFFAAIPTDRFPGMAFALVQHLAPDHKSLLGALIQRHTQLKVVEVTDGMTVEPNCAYVIPPNRSMAFRNGKLYVQEPSEPHGRRLPIDSFFRSLAEGCREHAIGVVLSGTGSDGALGIRAIKAAGGMAMAQLPASAEHDGMPTNAIATGLVDYILPPAEMPAQLLAYAEQALGDPRHGATLPDPQALTALEAIFALLRARTGHDFSEYKKRTILRRIERRMAVRQLTTLEAYAEAVQEHPEEVTALFRDLLIGVTDFFRDPDAFAALEGPIQHVLRHKQDGDTLRVWVPGCSTGEEAYSLAIVLQEQMEVAKRQLKLQLFATDIDPVAIEQARTGLYPASALADMAAARRTRYFALEGDGGRYRIHKSLREMLVFSEQNVIKDPPFSRLDLISCRNLLIYLGPELQSKLIPLFHYALNPGGLLLLGTSESVGSFGDLFTLLDPKAKLYERKNDVNAVLRRNSGLLFPSMSNYRTTIRLPDKAPRMRKYPLRELTERAVLQYHSPAAALINPQGEILYLHGRTGRYLEPPPGESSLNIPKMAREGLAHELRLALLEIAKGGKVVTRPRLRIRTNGDYSWVNLTIRFVEVDRDAPSKVGLYLVVWEEIPEPQLDPAPLAAKAAPGDVAEATAHDHLLELQRELQAQTDSLRTMTEDLESSNEELRAANEELQSVNEELQSTNEELETSKEELQAVNEELATVNAELQARVAELSRSNNDMNNLMAGTGVGTVFVDHELRIQRFTPTVTAVINLIPSDVGRPVGQIASNLIGYDTLVADTRGVLDTLVPKDLEVQSATASYLMRIRPYRTLDNVVEGAVITFTDITELKRTTDAMRRLAVVVRDSRDAVIVYDLAGQVLAWNAAAERLYGWTETEALQKNIKDLLPATNQPAALATIERLRNAEVLAPMRAQRVTKDGKTLTIALTASALVNEAGAVYAISTTERAEHDEDQQR